MNELIARIRAALRHRLQVQGQRPVFRVGELEVDLVRRKVTANGDAVKLSPKEYELLRLLVHHAGKTLTHEFLRAALWATPVDANSLRVYVRQLRAKIEPDPEHPHYIMTQSSIGYRLRSDRSLPALIRWTGLPPTRAAERTNFASPGWSRAGSRPRIRRPGSRLRWIGLDLVPELAHQDPQILGIMDLVRTPDVLEQLLMRDHEEAAWVASTCSNRYSLRVSWIRAPPTVDSGD